MAPSQAPNPARLLNHLNPCEDRCEPTGKNLFAAGAVWGLGMFLVLFYEVGSQWPLPMIALLFLGCCLGGLTFWGLMSAFVRFTLRDAKADRLPPKARTKRERAISLLSIPFACAPIFYVIAADDSYLWPVLASSVPAYFLMTPLMSRRGATKGLALRTLGSVLGGLFAGIATYQWVVKDASMVPSGHSLFLLMASSVSWCVSYLLSLAANRPSTAANA